MTNVLLDFMSTPFIEEKNGIISDVNEFFLSLTQFSKDELFGNYTTDILDKLLRCNNKINITNEEIETILFTKTFEVRFVKIKKYIHNDSHVYIFNEIENSRLDNKLIFIENLINDNKIGMAIYTANDLRLIKSNQKYLDYLPKPFNSKEVVYGKCLYEFLDRLAEENSKKLINNMLKTNKPLYFSEIKGHFLESNDYWDNTITPVCENGEVKFVMSMLENVTERVLSRNHINMKNKQLESIIESVDDVISIIDKNGNYSKHNALTKSLFNENDAKYLGHSTKFGKFYDFSGNPIPLENLSFMKVLNGEKVKEHKVKYIYKNKEYYLSINAIPIFDENGNFEAGVIATYDITELIESNKILSNQNKELEIIFQNIYDGLGIIDKNGNYIKKNKALTELLSRELNVSSLTKLGETFKLGKKYYNENDDELTLKDFPSYKVLKGETVKEQRLILKENHGNVYLDFNAVPIFDENGEFQYGILLCHSITHIIESNNKIKKQQELVIKAEQEKLEAAEKTLAMKDEFISLISHEFKTPLNVIYSAIQLIESVYINQTPDKVKILIKNIKQNTFRQLRLVNNLLDITRLNSGRFKLNTQGIDIVSFSEQICESVKLYSNQKKITLFFKYNVKCKNISTDDEKLERIILNLLSNALKFTNEGGTVTVNLYDYGFSEDIIAIEVSDTGLGIPKDKQELIFERFGQVDSNLSRHAEGTGIGLSLVKKLVDVLNGRIELESEVGVGSTFRIILPKNQYIEENKIEPFFDRDNRLVNALRVEFSDIYL